MDRQLADRYTDGEAGRYQIQLAHRIVRGVVGPTVQLALASAMSR